MLVSLQQQGPPVVLVQLQRSLRLLPLRSAPHWHASASCTLQTEQRLEAWLL